MLGSPIGRYDEENGESKSEMRAVRALSILYAHLTARRRQAEGADMRNRCKYMDGDPGDDA